MKKYNVDDILRKVGLDGPDGDGTREAGPPSNGSQDAKGPGLVKRHRVDQAELAFSPLPSMPGNQGATVDTALVKNDPAVKQHVAVPESTIGPALSPVFKPGQRVVERGELGAMLVASGVITTQQLGAAQQVIKQSPDRRLVEVLLEQGADEVAIQRANAEATGLVFERIDLKKGLDGGFDGKLAQRLTPEFCKEHLIMPLRQEGSRIVIGTTRSDDVFLIDDIKHKLGAPVKLVLVTSHDIKGALDLIGAPTQDEQVDRMESTRLITLHI